MRHGLMAAACAVAVVAAAPAKADVVADWMEFAQKLAGPPGSGSQNTPEHARTVTHVALALFEALNAIDRRYESYLKLPPGEASASQDAAAATAAYHALLHHLPAQKTALDDSYAIAMAEIADTPAKAAGKAIGEAAAKAAVASGGIDTTIPLTPYRPRTQPGVWTATALPSIEPFMWAMKPWAIDSAVALRAPPPPALNSERWARDYEEIRRLGGRTSTERTPHQTLMARYRQAPDLTPSLRAAADQPNRRPVQNARMYALYQMAADDAVLPMTESKNHYNFWRPITAIRNGADDGNDATQPDPAWTPLLATPNFPEYPCGHCTYAAAVAEVMKAETGPRPRSGVRVASQAIPNSVMQVLPSWDEWVKQVSLSRTYGGVHYRFANEAGEEIGRKAASVVLAKVMRPLPGRR